MSDDAVDRLKRQIWRLLDVRSRTTSELMHFTGEDLASLRGPLLDMPNVMWDGHVWKVVAP